jgi:hypothetical protein
MVYQPSYATRKISPITYPTQKTDPDIPASHNMSPVDAPNTNTTNSVHKNQPLPQIRNYPARWTQSPRSTLALSPRQRLHSDCQHNNGTNGSRPLSHPTSKFISITLLVRTQCLNRSLPMFAFVIPLYFKSNFMTCEDKKALNKAYYIARQLHQVDLRPPSSKASHRIFPTCS